MCVCRYADDVELNQELKERERWNDPAAGFLTVSCVLLRRQRLIVKEETDLMNHYRKNQPQKERDWYVPPIRVLGNQTVS